jgi:surface polysaccharide O-acyltransferase-like enzyme
VPGVSLPYGLGGFVVLAALLLPRMRYNVESVSVCTFGIYLVHIAALGVFNRITGQGSITTVCSTFVASLIGVWLVRRYMPMSRAVLG